MLGQMTMKSRDRLILKLNSVTVLTVYITTNSCFEILKNINSVVPKGIFIFIL